MDNKVVCVVGPTACGKTKMGVALAKRFGGNPDLGTQILLTTTVASFITLPCWLALGSSLVVPLY